MIRPKREGRSVVGFSDFVAELKRRRVIRALLGWGIASFAVLQVYEPVMHGLHLPEWTLSFVVVILGLGFPVTAALAWMFDLKASGIERTRPLANGDSPTDYRSRGARLALPLGLGLAAATPGLVYFFVWPGPAFRDAGQATRPPQAPPSVAVLPFADMSEKHDQEYLADGVAEEILNTLAQVEGLKVIGRTSSFSFKGKDATLSVIGRTLHVGALLEGSVRREGGRVRDHGTAREDRGRGARVVADLRPGAFRGPRHPRRDRAGGCGRAQAGTRARREGGGARGAPLPGSGSLRPVPARPRIHAAWAKRGKGPSCYRGVPEGPDARRGLCPRVGGIREPPGVARRLRDDGGRGR